MHGELTVIIVLALFSTTNKCVLNHAKVLISIDSHASLGLRRGDRRRVRGFGDKGDRARIYDRVASGADEGTKRPLSS